MLRKVHKRKVSQVINNYFGIISQLVQMPGVMFGEILQ